MLQLLPSAKPFPVTSASTISFFPYIPLESDWGGDGEYVETEVYDNQNGHDEDLGSVLSHPLNQGDFSFYPMESVNYLDLNMDLGLMGNHLDGQANQNLALGLF